MPLTNARRKAYSKGYYENNRTRISTAKRERYAAHSDEKRVAKRERYASHSDEKRRWREGGIPLILMKKRQRRERYTSHSDEKKAAEREVYLSF